MWRRGLPQFSHRAVCCLHRQHLLCGCVRRPGMQPLSPQHHGRSWPHHMHFGPMQQLPRGLLLQRRKHSHRMPSRHLQQLTRNQHGRCMPPMRCRHLHIEPWMDSMHRLCAWALEHHFHHSMHAVRCRHISVRLRRQHMHQLSHRKLLFGLRRPIQQHVPLVSCWLLCYLSRTCQRFGMHALRSRVLLHRLG